VIFNRCLCTSSFFEYIVYIYYHGCGFGITKDSNLRTILATMVNGPTCFYYLGLSCYLIFRPLFRWPQLFSFGELRSSVLFLFGSVNPLGVQFIILVVTFRWPCLCFGVAQVWCAFFDWGSQFFGCSVNCLGGYGNVCF